ncbi:hypothetical protein GCM10022243_02430 [Saccharothrix violaceirubra]|uniref:AAA domain-containing protein n=1 Tax=Saccharothrix violaceirubra TaxID=413306 RepID=A0A7W7T691_9PSEU|nr:AAA family ATPase [Saccharothrix violaceirubra]MBB4966000.1 hypothetical protein [Saccharothrix violaceirubra]
MLIWINGPFGGGKTATAHELHRRVEGSVLADPEYFGFALHRLLPPALRGDFQDLPTWRTGVYDMLDLALTQHEGPIIVPMTVVNADYFAEIVGRLREQGHRVEHFALLAEPATVLARLSGRGLWPGLKREGWAVSKLDHCLKRLHEPEFAEHVDTDDRTVAQVADAIARSAGLPIVPDNDSPLRARLRRYATSVRHLRFD